MFIHIRRQIYLQTPSLCLMSIIEKAQTVSYVSGRTQTPQGATQSASPSLELPLKSDLLFA